MDAATVRALLEGYNVDSTVISDTWIDKRISDYIIPYVEKLLRLSLFSEKQITEYYSGTGSPVLILNKKPVVSLDKITSVGNSSNSDLSSFELIPESGMIRAKNYSADNLELSIAFPRGNKNIKVTYTYGYLSPPDDLKEVITNLAAEQVLSFVGSCTGGGDLNINGYSRSFGEHGKWTHIRKDLNKYSIGILRMYMTGIVGSV